MLAVAVAGLILAIQSNSRSKKTVSGFIGPTGSTENAGFSCDADGCTFTGSISATAITATTGDINITKGDLNVPQGSINCNLGTVTADTLFATNVLEVPKLFSNQKITNGSNDMHIVGDLYATNMFSQFHNWPVSG